LKSYGVDEAALRLRAQAAGIAPERLRFLPFSATTADHLGRYSEIDIALDPFPYHGTTTTCEALWMGVPVLSLRGDRHASRVGASLLTAVGHPEWIAYSEDGYIEIAKRLAADRAQLARIRANLREDLRRSALLDHPGQAKRFGEALRQCWATYCTQAPAQ
jgi:predicted O-linked N-acetylglucosamine transferase (SPINDLY family)